MSWSTWLCRICGVRLIPMITTCRADSRFAPSQWETSLQSNAVSHWLGASLESALTLQWHHNERDGVSNHQPQDCLLNRLFRHRSKKTSKLRVTGLCEGNSPVTGEFPAQRASNEQNVSIWWRHHDMCIFCITSHQDKAPAATHAQTPTTDHGHSPRKRPPPSRPSWTASAETSSSTWMFMRTRRCGLRPMVIPTKGRQITGKL